MIKGEKNRKTLILKNSCDSISYSERYVNLIPNFERSTNWDPYSEISLNLIPRKNALDTVKWWIKLKEKNSIEGGKETTMKIKKLSIIRESRKEGNFLIDYILESVEYNLQ